MRNEISPDIYSYEVGVGVHSTITSHQCRQRHRELSILQTIEINLTIGKQVTSRLVVFVDKRKMTELKGKICIIDDFSIKICSNKKTVTM